MNRLHEAWAERESQWPGHKRALIRSCIAAEAVGFILAHLELGTFTPDSERRAREIVATWEKSCE